MDIRNILYKSIEQEVSSGTNFKLFSVDNKNAYTIRIYIDSGSDNFSLEVNNSIDKNNYKIENFKIGQNIDIYKIKSDSVDTSVDTYYIKFANNTSFTIRKEIVYGYLTNANTESDSTSLSDTNKIVSLTTSSPKHIFVGNSSFVGDTNISGDTNITGALTANNDVTVNGTTKLGDNVSDQINFNADTTVNGTANLASLTANGNVTIAGTTKLGDNVSDQINFNEGTTIQGTTSFAKNLTANGNVTITGTTKLGDNVSDQINFNESTTVVGTTNLSGEINFHNFYINDFINTPEPGTEQPSGKSKIVFRDDSESVEIYGIYNEILQPIKVDDSRYTGKITILASISNQTLSDATPASDKLTLLKLAGTNEPQLTYTVEYTKSLSRIDIISSDPDEGKMSTIMMNGNYISNIVTIPFKNNITCKVTEVYVKNDEENPNEAITIYKVADKIIGGGDNDSNASHYLLTAQSLSQILTLSSLSAGATTTNLTKNPDSTFNYDGGKNYLLYQTGSSATNVYNTNETGKRFIFIENDKVQDKEGTVINKADTVLLRGTNGDINVGNIISSGYVESNGDFYTKTTDTYSLGRSDKYFVNGYIRNISSSTIATSDITAATANLTTITGKFDKKIIVKAANTTVASYNGYSDDEFNIVAGANISVSGNENGTITVAHPNHTTANVSAGFTSEYKLSIPDVKSDGQGHIIGNGRTEIDLSQHYLRCDADDEKSGLTKFTGNININSASNSENANSGKIIFSDTSSDTISIFKSDITETGHSLCTKIFDNGITATYKFSFKNFGNNATYEYTMPNKAGQIMLANDNYAGSTSPGGSANSVANSFTYGVSAGSATSTSYNGGDAKTLYIVGSNGLSTSFSGSNTVTISHPTYTGHTQTAAWGSGGDAHKLFIPKIKSNSYGHIESTTENEPIDLSIHYLRCDADDDKSGTTTFSGQIISSNVIKLTGNKVNTSKGLLSIAADGTTSLSAGQGMIFSNAIGFTNSGVATDVGWMRVLGTAEENTILELATGDDGGSGESIHFRGYTTSGTIGYDVTVPKENGTILTTHSAKIEKTSEEQFSITINGKTITFKQTGGEGSALEITCS